MNTLIYEFHPNIIYHLANEIERLKGLLPNFVSNASNAHSQPAKELLFAELLDEIFGIKPENLDMEVPVSSKMMLVRGRIDTVFGDLIIEFKVSLEREMEDAHRELVKYFQSFREKYPKQKFVGIATDDLNFVVYRPKVENNIVTDITEIDRIDLRQKINEPEAVFLWFDSYFFISKKIVPTSKDIRKRFGIESPTYNFFIQDLQDLYEVLKNKNQVKVKFENWLRYLEIVYGDKPSGTSLFINHTYLAIVAKLLVHYRLTSGKPVERINIKRLIFGDTFREYGILNFIEEDFFTWFFQRNNYDVAIDLVFKLAKELQVYNLEALDEDILKELYQEMVSVEVRHTLGEYYTPDWLAERIVQGFVNEEPEGSFLDPSCGSGTFLFSAISLIIPLLKKKGISDEKILAHILDNVVGIDINPIAVVISRTNYLLALKDIIRSRKSAVQIPIYLSDAIKFPQFGLSINNAVPHYKMYASPKMMFEIPQTIAEQPHIMDSIIEKMREHSVSYQETLEAAVRYTGDPEKLRSGILNSFERSIKEIPESPTKSMIINNLRIMTELIDLGYDSIWAYILKNFLKPIAFMRRKFRFIIGNPPWLALQFMMNEEYQDFLKRETFAYGLIGKSQTHLITHMEMATLFFCKISDTYLENGGKIGFVMPKSVLTAFHHINFINMTFEKSKNLLLKVEKIFNTEEVRPLFNIPSCAIIASKGIQNRYPVPMLLFKGTLSTTNERWIDAKSQLSISESTYEPQSVILENRSEYYNLFHQGATMFPRNFWFIQFESDSTFGFNPDLPLVRSSKDNDTKPPWNKVTLEGNIEPGFLFATIIGNEILPFGFKRFRPVVLPLFVTNGRLKLIESKEEAFRNGFVNMTKFLEKAENAWKSNATDKGKSFTIYQWLNYRNKLTNQNPQSMFKVLYVAAATFLASCVISTSDRLISDVNNTSVNLRAFVAESKTYYYETNDELEAYYLCAILNSKVVDNWIKPLQNTGQFGERDIHKRPLFLPIPRFDSKNDVHKSLAKVGLKCKNKVIANLSNIQSKSIGRDRTKVRELLSPELNEINELTKQLLPLPSTT